MKLNALLQAIGASDRLLDGPGTSLWNAGALAESPKPTGYCQRDAATVTLRAFAPRMDETPPEEIFFAQFSAQEPQDEAPPGPALDADRARRVAELRLENADFSRWIRSPAELAELQAELQASLPAPRPERIWRLSHVRIRSLPVPLSERDALALFRGVCAHTPPQLVLDETRRVDRAVFSDRAPAQAVSDPVAA